MEEPPSPSLPRQTRFFVFALLFASLSLAFASATLLPTHPNYVELMAALGLLTCNGFFTMVVAALAASRAGNGARLKLLASAQLGQSFSALGFAVFAIPFMATLLPHFLRSIYPSLEQSALWSALQTFSLLLAWLLLAFVYALLRQSLKGYAEARHERFLATFKPLLQAWHGLVYPLTSLLLRAYRLTFSWVGVEQKALTSQTEKLRLLLQDELEPSHETADKPADDKLAADRLAAEAQKLLHNVLNFSDKQIKDIMIPRTDVLWIDVNRSLEHALSIVHDSGYSRFPLCQGSPDEVIGYVHAKDIIAQQIASEPQPLAALLRPVSFIPDTAPAPQVLANLQGKHRHFAIVLDEFGGMEGLLTLEDLLEQLVGDIRDEFDQEEEDALQKVADNHYLVDGHVRLDVLQQTLGLDFDEVEEDTIGGYILARLAQAHSLSGDTLDLTRWQNKTLTLAGVQYEVVRCEGLRITQVRMRLRKASARANAVAA